MSDPQDRLGFILPGLPRFCEIEAQGSIVTAKRHVRRKASQGKFSPAKRHDAIVKDNAIARYDY